MIGPDKKNVVWDISWMSIIRVIIVLVGFYLLFYLADVILILFFVLILTSALAPLVEKIKRKLGIPKSMAILLIFLGLLLFLALMGYLIIPPAAEQIQNIAKDFPSYAQRLKDFFGAFGENATGSSGSLQSASSTLNNFAKTLLQSASGFVGGVVTVVSILILTLFLLFEEDGIRRFFVSLLPISQKTYVVEVSRKISEKMGSWLVGQISLMGVIAFTTTLGLGIMRIPYALTLGLIAGLLEIIPTVGPIIASIPAILIAYLHSPFMGVVVLIFYIIVQQLENQLLVPKIMQKAVGVSPFIILVALLIGSKLAGVMGMLLAVPTVAAISVISLEWPNIRKRI